MKLSNQSIPNSVSDARLRQALEDLHSQQCDEFEDVHNGSGRSEELPSDLAKRHAAEKASLLQDYETMGVMQWIRWYGNKANDLHQARPGTVQPR